jgi:hypothetical protein
MDRPSLRAFRKSRGATLEGVCAELGRPKSFKSQLSRVESGAIDCPFKLAFELEAWSEGQLRAVDLLGPERARVVQGAVARAITAPPSGAALASPQKSAPT